MSVSRRLFLADASVFGLLAALLPELTTAQNQTSPAQESSEDLPHDSFDFWNGFYDSVNPYSSNYGSKAATRGPTDQLPDPKAQTQYLHYSATKKRLRYATDIDKDELLDHDGDVSVSIALAQFRPGEGEAGLKASQLRVDATQIHPFINIAAPLAWAAIASISPNTAGKISLDDMGFKSVQATQGTSKILLTKGTGKVSVNISKAAQQSMFIKALNLMIQAGKAAAPLVSLPAISVPALSTFTEALSYWEDRTRFIMAGNLTTAVATQQALNAPEREAAYIGLVPGDYLMVPQRHIDELSKALPNLDLVQGYLVAKDANPDLPLPQRAQSAVPGVTYASMRIGVIPVEGSCAGSSSGGILGGLLGGSGSESGSGKSSSGSSHSGTGSGKSGSGSGKKN
jgi:hypothetical protein